MIIVQGIRRDELQQWKGSQMTQAIFKAIADKLDMKRRDSGRGVGLDVENADKTQANSFRAYGYCEALDEVLNLTTGD
ncbi:MAG: hypothetical protein C4542_08100 [Dehalococcoidia bacterium]|nr:MAG: hypothetical protein C4542_08100 [Dehalococcoidia bacterium]